MCNILLTNVCSRSRRRTENIAGLLELNHPPYICSTSKKKFGSSGRLRNITTPHNHVAVPSTEDQCPPPVFSTVLRKMRDHVGLRRPRPSGFPRQRSSPPHAFPIPRLAASSCVESAPRPEAIPACRSVVVCCSDLGGVGDVGHSLCCPISALAITPGAIMRET